KLSRDFFLLLSVAGFIDQEFDQAFHRRLMNRAMIVADEVADDRKPPVRISLENNAFIERSEKDVGLAFDFILPKMAERRVGEERNEPFLLPAPFGRHQTRQGFLPRAPIRLAILDNSLQKSAVAFGPRRVALLRGVLVKQSQSQERHGSFSG